MMRSSAYAALGGEAGIVRRYDPRCHSHDRILSQRRSYVHDEEAVRLTKLEGLVLRS